VSRRRGTQHVGAGGRARAGSEARPGRPVEGRVPNFGLMCIKCGEEAVTVCPECGPECLDCFMAGGVMGET
jgi:hypothetical protein